jgi:hypothetical protein
MGTVADVNYGFKGQVTSAQTPVVLGIGARYAVIGSGLKATAGGAGDRAVTVSAGTAWGDGVLSTWNTSGVVNAAANSTGSTRWDTLVIRRHWQPASSPTGTSTLLLLTGGSSKAIAVSRETDRGVTNSDQPIALVPVANGSAVAGPPVDLRCWAGNGGGLVAENVEALQYLDEKGTQVRIGNTLHTRMENGSGTRYWDEVDLSRMIPWERLEEPTYMSGNGGTAATGWYGGSEPTLNNARVVRGRDFELYLRLRLGSGTVPVDANGAFTGTPTIFTLDPAWRPLYMYPFAFTYRTTTGGVRSGIGRVLPEGDVQLVSGVAGSPIDSFTAAQGYSFMAQLRHTIP